MREESFVSRTKIVQSFFAVWSFDKSVLRAFAVAGKTDLALAAILRQQVSFIAAEFELLFRSDHLAQALVHDVAQAVLRIYIVVATVKIAIMFDGQRGSAFLRKHTQR